MIDIATKEFEKLKYRVDLVPLSENCCDKIPDLKNIFLEYKGYKTPTLTNDLLVRFIVLTYDQKSPFVEKLNNIKERKVAVLNYLQIQDKDGVFPEDIQDIVKSTDPTTARVVYQYCKFQYSLAYFAFVTTVETYISMNERLGEDISSAKDTKDTADILVKLDKVEERIEKLSDKLFKRDTDLKDFIGSVLVVEGRKKKILPEDWAV